MNLVYQPALISELPAIIKIERSGFSPAEAATKAAMRQRIQSYPETFLTAHNQDHQLVGYVVGPASTDRYINDDLFADAQPNDPNAPLSNNSQLGSPSGLPTSRRCRRLIGRTGDDFQATAP